MELNQTIKTIDSLKSELDKLRPIPEESMDRYMQKIRLDWNYHSNSIEGNTLSLNETKQLILYGITAKGKPIRDHIEMQGHNKALHRLEDIVHKEINITENLIKEFHKLILVEPYDSDAEINPGNYKKTGNYLYTKTNERIDFEPPKEVPRLMNELVNWLNNHIDPPKRKKNKYDLHPLLIAAGFHSQFIKIHPFGDGNGRTARIIMNLILMLTGYVPAIIKLDDRDIYYNVLNESSQSDPEPLASFIGNQLIHSLELMIKAAKGESIEDPDDLDKKLALLQKEIDAEDEENEIKEKLTVQAFKNTLDNWGYNLLEKLAATTAKFNSFYDSPKHNVYLHLQNLNIHTPYINFTDQLKFDEIKEFWNNEGINLEQETHEAELRFGAHFGGFIKGGLNPFRCNYTIEVKFEQYHYTVITPLLSGQDEYGNIKTDKQEIKKLLHQPLTEDEINSINKTWGETLLQHLETNRAKLKNGK